LIRQHIDPLDPGLLLEVISLEASVEVDLPAWCRLTKNDLVSWCRQGDRRSFLICKGKFDQGHSEGRERQSAPATRTVAGLMSNSIAALPRLLVASGIRPLSVMGIGSWPRPHWLLRSLHEWLERRISDEEFQSVADDAVRLAVHSQLRAGVDVLTDGEQRRNNYFSFVGGLLDNCQLIPLTDLLPLGQLRGGPDQYFVDIDVLGLRHCVHY
jgi:5-methyltetrahydropteroyltriglutamate--homocysteine methyltransferase